MHRTPIKNSPLVAPDFSRIHPSNSKSFQHRSVPNSNQSSGQQSHNKFVPTNDINPYYPNSTNHPTKTYNPSKKGRPQNLQTETAPYFPLETNTTPKMKNSNTWGRANPLSDSYMANRYQTRDTFTSPNGISKPRESNDQISLSIPREGAFRKPPVPSSHQRAIEEPHHS
jgi:hypothetical protein